MGTGRTRFVLFARENAVDDATIEAAFADLRGKREKCGTGAWTFTVSRCGFDVTRNDAEYVREEAAEMADDVGGHLAERVRAADTRFEILYDLTETFATGDVLEQVTVRLAALCEGVILDQDGDQFEEAVFWKPTTLAESELAKLRAFLPEPFQGENVDLRVDDVVQPFFPSWVVLDVTATREEPSAGSRAFVACSPDTRFLMLTGDANALDMLAGEDPSPIITSARVAQLFAHHAEAWLYGVRSRPRRGLSSAADLGEQGAEVDAPIAPVATTRTATGFTIVTWMVDDGCLVRRTAEVGSTGTYRHDDTIVANDVEDASGDDWNVV